MSGKNDIKAQWSAFQVLADAVPPPSKRAARRPALASVRAPDPDEVEATVDTFTDETSAAEAVPEPDSGHALELVPHDRGQAGSSADDGSGVAADVPDAAADDPSDSSAPGSLGEVVTGPDSTDIGASDEVVVADESGAPTLTEGTASGEEAEHPLDRGTQTSVDTSANGPVSPPVHPQVAPTPVKPASRKTRPVKSPGVVPAKVPASLGGGRRISLKGHTAHRQTEQWTERIRQTLTSSGVKVKLTDAVLEAASFTVTVHTDDLDALVDVLPELVEELHCEDLDITVGQGALQLWIPTEGEGPAKQAAVWVPAAIRERVREHTKVTGQSVSQLTLRAFNELFDEFDTWFNGPDEAGEGPMSVSGRRRRADVETAVQLWLYLTPAQRARLDAAEKRSGAGSRSALVSELLNRYLNAAH